MHGNRNILLATLQFPTTWDNNFVAELGDRLLRMAGLKQLGFTSFYYQNSNKAFGGVTHVWFLAESHMIIETFREGEIMEVEIVTCKGELVDKKFHTLFQSLGLTVLSMDHLKKTEDHKWRAF
jgi:S-adenosylmethionine/arginine decarboxylase-like enzyme